MMIDRRTVFVLIASVGFDAAALASAKAAALRSPDKVKLALRLMMQVINDFDRQITRKTYARLPHENGEFHEAADALREAIAGEPATFVGQVEPALKKALDAAQKVSNESAGGDDAKLRAGQAQLLKAANRVFDLFPPDLRPDPNAQGGRH